MVQKIVVLSIFWVRAFELSLPWRVVPKMSVDLSVNACATKERLLTLRARIFLTVVPRLGVYSPWGRLHGEVRPRG